MIPDADTDTNHDAEDTDGTEIPYCNDIKGKIVVDGNEYGFDVSFGHGTTVWFWSRRNQSIKDGTKLFAGDCKFSKDKLTVYCIRYNDYGILPDDTEYRGKYSKRAGRNTVCVFFGLIDSVSILKKVL